MKHYVVVTFHQLLLLLLFSPALWGDGKAALGFLSPQLDLFSSSAALALALADLYDPFRILEHIPLSLEKDDATLPAALVDWKETPDKHLILIDVPGLKKDDLKIEVEENRVLRVSGERKQEEKLLREDNKKKKEDHWHRVERTSYGRFWRQFRLPDNVDLDSIEAKLEDGVLTLSLPKLSPDKIKALCRLVHVNVTPAAGGENHQQKKHVEL